jgi:NADPH2:quinone reductase
VGHNVACLSGTGGFGTHAGAGGPVHAAAGGLPRGCRRLHHDLCHLHHALIDRAQLKAGETVLVLGAAGGVGTAPSRSPRRPARVIAAASTDEKCALCKRIGADATINYNRQPILREASRP